MSMFINISELISTPLKTETFTVPVDMDFYELQGDRFPFREKGKLILTISNAGNRKVHLEGHWQGSPWHTMRSVPEGSGCAILR